MSAGSAAGAPSVRKAAAEPRWLRLALTAVGLSFLFFWTLLSPAAKPEGMQNQAPFLLAACALAALGPAPAPAARAAARASPRE